MKNELITPCPKCGGADFGYHDDTEIFHVGMFCYTCKHKGPLAIGVDGAILAWNEQAEKAQK